MASLYFESLALDTLVGRLRRCSPTIEDYMARELYIQAVESVEDITESFIITRCLELLLDELKQLGLILNVPIENVVDNHEAIDALAEIRYRLDTDMLKTVFKDLISDDWELLDQQLVPDDDGDLGQQLTLVAEFICSRLPMSQEWNHILVNSYMVISDNKFGEHVRAVLKMVSVNGPEAKVTEHNVGMVTKFLLDTMFKRDVYKVILTELLSRDLHLGTIPGSPITRNEIVQSVDNYDMDLVHHQELSLIARHHAEAELTDTEALDMDMIDAIHHKQSLHHLDHHTDYELIPREALVMVLAHDLGELVEKGKLDLSKHSHGVLQDIVKKSKSKINDERIDYLKKLLQHINYTQMSSIFKTINQQGVTV